MQRKHKICPSGDNTRHRQYLCPPLPIYQVTVAHAELWIFASFLINQSEQICKWGIKYADSVTTDHVGSTCAHCYHIPSFVTVAASPCRTLDICLFFITNQNRYTQMRYLYAHSVTTNHIPSFMKISHRILIREAKVYLFGWRAIDIHPYILTITYYLQQKSK